MKLFSVSTNSVDLNDVMAALARNNLNTGAGYIERFGAQDAADSSRQ